MAVNTNGSQAGPVESTDQKPGNRVYVGNNQPAGPEIGDLWIDQSTTSSAASVTDIAIITGAY